MTDQSLRGGPGSTDLVSRSWAGAGASEALSSLHCGMEGAQNSNPSLHPHRDNRWLKRKVGGGGQWLPGEGVGLRMEPSGSSLGHNRGQRKAGQ